VVGAEAAVAGLAVDQRVGEAGEMARGLPGLGVLDDRGVQRDDVVTLLEHRVPPGVDDVALEQHAVVPIVIGVGDPPVDLGGGEDQAAALAQRHDLVHRHDVFGGHARDSSRPLGRRQRRSARRSALALLY
jgi:hypothetical protein